MPNCFGWPTDGEFDMLMGAYYRLFAAMARERCDEETAVSRWEDEGGR